MYYITLSKHGITNTKTNKTMAKETHSIELTIEEIASIIKAEFTIQGEFIEMHDPTHGLNKDDVMQFDFNQPKRELPF